MILFIDTTHDITPDILHDISVQIEQGLTSGIQPYSWKISSLDNLTRDDFGMNSNIESEFARLDDDIDEKDEAINDLEEQITDLENNVSNLEGRLEDAQKQIDELEAKL